MKQCPHCKIEVIGNTIVCPLCQNDLRGKGEADLWPFALRLKKQSVIYRLQLFIMLTLAVICGALDFLFDLHGQIHWSFPVIIWIIAIQFMIVSQYKHFINLSRLINCSMFDIGVMLMITSWYLGFFKLCVGVIIPSMFSAVIVADFLLMLIDRKKNALAYALAGNAIAILTFVVLYFIVRKTTIMWNICVMLAVISMIGAIVFKGKHVFEEAEKRLSV